MASRDEQVTLSQVSPPRSARRGKGRGSMTAYERSGLYPTVRGGLVQLNAGDVWKYGISTYPANRYPMAAMQTLGLRMDMQATGSLSQVYVAEKAQLIQHFISNGSLPPGNRIFK